MPLPRSVLITGARGFAGRHLLAALQARGVTVVRGPEPGRDVDVTDPASIATTLQGTRPEAIVHLAARTYLPAVLADPRASFAVNVGGTLHVLEAAARETPGARVLVVSSSTVYGSPVQEALLTESSCTDPKHPYALQKLFAEALAERAGAQGQRVLVVRPFNHVGAGMQPEISLAHFARQIAQIERGLAPPTLLAGNLAAVRDFLHVEDVVDAYIRLLEYDGPERCFNVASGQGHSISELLQRFLRMTETAIEVGLDPARLRNDDPPFLVGDASRLAAATGWKAAHPLDAALADILAEARRWANDS